MNIIKERLCLSDYQISGRAQSKINPRDTVGIECGIGCPKCSIINKNLEHGETTLCKCGLKMIVYGNSLHCELRGNSLKQPLLTDDTPNNYLLNNESEKEVIYEAEFSEVSNNTKGHERIITCLLDKLKRVFPLFQKSL
jgi:hypothetical protein